MDVRRWRFRDVAGRLLDGGTCWDPPPDWTCWSKPTTALPIDNIITSLRHSNRNPRLRSREELGGQGILCPYHAARWQIAHAVDAATVAAADDPADMARRWRVHEEEARKAAGAVATIAESLLLATEAPMTRWPIVEPPGVTRIYEMLFALHRGDSA